MATTSHGTLHQRKGMGLVHEIFNQEIIETLPGSSGIGHVRYSTTGTSDLENAQPIIFKLRQEDAAIAHNGDIVNFERIRRRLQAQGVELLGSADSETVAQMIALEFGRTRDLETAIRRACQELVGGYAIVLLVGSKVVGFRDPLGIRPLVLGALEGGMAVASESVAVELMGGRAVRDLAPGEIVILSHGEVLSTSKIPGSGARAHCMFEFVYFSRPDSVAETRSVYEVRHRIGERLAREAPVEADIGRPHPSQHKGPDANEDVDEDFDRGADAHDPSGLVSDAGCGQSLGANERIGNRAAGHRCTIGFHRQAHPGARHHGLSVEKVLGDKGKKQEFHDGKDHHQRGNHDGDDRARPMALPVAMAADTPQMDIPDAKGAAHSRLKPK